MKLSDYVFEFLVARGVERVYLLTGGGAMHLNNSVGGQKRLEPIFCLHEQACSIAAEAEAKITGRPAVCLVTTGPGGTNAITGLAGAWIDSVPLIFISGQAKRSDLLAGTGVRQMGVQEVDIVSIVRPITKYAATVMDPSAIRQHLEEAWHWATTGRQGPVWIDIPLDVQGSTIDVDALPAFAAPAPSGPPSELKSWVDRAIELFNASQRPVLLLGAGVHWANAREQALELADALGAPMLAASSLNIDLAPEDHPLFFGRPGAIAPRYANFTLQNCDFLLAIGTRLDLATTGFAHDRFARSAKKIMVDIDEAEIRKMKTPIEVKAVVDARLFIEALLARRDELAPRERSEWLSRCREWKKRYPTVLAAHRDQREPVSTYRLADALSNVMREGDVLATGSSGTAIELFHLVFRSKTGQRAIHTRGLGAMGYGIPAAIGACLASGRRPVVAVDGDGGFYLNIQELATVARLRLPIKFFVINNDGYSSIRSSQQNYFGRVTGADPSSGVVLPDLRRISEAFGVPARRLTHQVDLEGQLQTILDHPGPLVIDVVVTPDETRMPRLASFQRPDGSMVSRPLEDLWPFLDRDEFRDNMIIPPLEE